MENFVYQPETFADIRIMRYQVPGFDNLSSNDKKLLYYFSKSCIAGRNITWDQNHSQNLEIRGALEKVYLCYSGDKSVPEWELFCVYLKQIWVSNGIHHGYSSQKILPEFDQEYLKELLNDVGIIEFPFDLIYNPEIQPLKVEQSDQYVGEHIQRSAVNFYDRSITDEQAKEYYTSQNYPQGVMRGLNSKLVQNQNGLQELVWKVGGIYNQELKQVVYWLKRALSVTNEAQTRWVTQLIRYYETGDLIAFRDFNIEWLKDTNSNVDMIQGFIETYSDPLGYKGMFEGIVQVKDPIGSQRVNVLQNNAQWFEDHLPVMYQHKRKVTKGICANAIHVVCMVGDCAPMPVIGVNLPNDEHLRSTYGSKSVTLGNIIDAYGEIDKTSGLLFEFMKDETAIAGWKAHGDLFFNLEVDIHECLGHASGQLENDVPGKSTALKAYGSTIEEARADLVALYFITDPKLVELGLVPQDSFPGSLYDQYFASGLMLQLRRVKPGDSLHEAHMRNRQMITKWVIHHTDAVEIMKVDGNTTIKIHDYHDVRYTIGLLLREVQRIKSQGDFDAAQNIVETYGVTVDLELHQEVLDRVAKYDVKPYTAIINPQLSMDGNERVTLEYPMDFAQQMLYYSL
jgi:dipeptidyl-peptidase-3